MYKPVVGVVLMGLAFWGIFGRKAEHPNSVLFFHAEWCGPCNKMKEDTLTDSSVQEALEDRNFVKIDIDNDRRTANNYNVNSVPTYIQTDGKGREIKRGSGYKGPRDFIRWLE